GEPMLDREPVGAAAGGRHPVDLDTSSLQGLLGLREQVVGGEAQATALCGVVDVLKVALVTLQAGEPNALRARADAREVERRLAWLGAAAVLAHVHVDEERHGHALSRRV